MYMNGDMNENEKNKSNRIRSSSAQLYSISGEQTGEKRKMQTMTVKCIRENQDAGETPVPNIFPTARKTRSLDDTIVWSTGSNENTIVGMDSIQENVMSRISTLACLREEGFIDDEEFQRRKKAIIDEITYQREGMATKINGHGGRKSLKLKNGIPLIIPHSPNFAEIEPEDAVRHAFNYNTRQWEISEVRKL